MNKTQETAIGIAVAIILVGYFIYQVAYGTNGSVAQAYGQEAIITAPQGSQIENVTIRDESPPVTHYIPPTINFTMESSPSKECPSCAVGVFTLTNK